MAEWGAVQGPLEATAPPAPLSGARIWQGRRDKGRPGVPNRVTRWKDVRITMSHATIQTEAR